MILGSTYIYQLYNILNGGNCGLEKLINWEESMKKKWKKNGKVWPDPIWIMLMTNAVQLGNWKENKWMTISNFICNKYQKN